MGIVQGESDLNCNTEESGTGNNKTLICYQRRAFSKQLQRYPNL